MSKLRRLHGGSNVYFVAVVTYRRMPILIDNVDLLWRAIRRVRAVAPFRLIAWVVLPEHIHLIVDPVDSSVSKVLQRIKMSFAASLRQRLGVSGGRTWQHRFWDHVIRSEDDLNRHLDYVHFNPMKHGLVLRPSDWPHSSFQEFVGRGQYGSDWGTVEQPALEGQFGE